MSSRNIFFFNENSSISDQLTRGNFLISCTCHSRSLWWQCATTTETRLKRVLVNWSVGQLGHLKG